MITHTIAAGQKTLKMSKIIDTHRSLRLPGKESDPLNPKRSKKLYTEVQDGERSVILLTRPFNVKV